MRNFLFVILAMLQTAVFAQNLQDKWTVEAESPDTRVVLQSDGVIDMLSPKGLTLWYNERMSGDVVIEYDAQVVNNGGEGERTSDLNCFWMAQDPKNPDNIFKRLEWRGGVFLKSYSLQLYYLGFGGNSNTTTRFRKYDGDERGIKDEKYRPAILKEYKDEKHLLKPNHWYHIKLVSQKGRVKYFIDGECLVDFADKQLTSGWFGFRTTWSHTQLKNFRYTAKGKAFSADKVALNWIGTDKYAIPTATTWGVPFDKGEVKHGTQFELQTSEGNVPLDCYTLAYWPDGSVKWGGFAGVVPADAQQLYIVKSNAKKSGTQLVLKRDGNKLNVNTGVLEVEFTEGSEALLNHMILKGRKVAGKASLVCSLKKTVSGKSSVTTENDIYGCEVEKVEVERQGNLAAVVKVSGKHVRNERKWLPFIVRFYFYANSEQVKVVHTIVYDGDQDKDFISSLGLQFEVPMREAWYNRSVAFSTGNGGVWAEPVQPLVGRRVLGATGPKGKNLPKENYQQMQMDGVRVPEAETFDQKGQFLIKNWASWGNYRLSQTQANGFSIRKQTNGEHPWIGTFNGYRADGFVFAGDLTGGLGVSLQDFWQSYPSTLEVSNARDSVALLKVWLWSPEGEAMDLRHYDDHAHDLEASYEDVLPGMSTPTGIGRTSTLILFPMAAYPGKSRIADYARTGSKIPQLICLPEYLHAKRAFGVWSLPSSKGGKIADVEKRLDDYIEYYKHAIDEHGWYGFWNYGDVMHAYDPVRHEWRYDVGGYAWDNTELASNMWLWYNFLRSGRSDIWDMAVAMTRHTSEVDVYHLGEYAGLGSRHNVSHWGCGCKQVRIAQSAWHRFFYYLTGDERTGELMEDELDSDYTLLTLDPMRFADPRTADCTAPARISIGPDWLGYACNWMTHWERFRDNKYRDKIITGMKSISALPSGIFTGPIALGYDPKTGIISKEGDMSQQATSHLMTIMGGFEVMNEMMEMIKLPEWEKTWLDFATRYKEMAYKTRRNKFRIARLMAYAAAHGDKEKGREAWQDLIRDGNNLKPLEVKVLQQPEVPEERHEAPEVNTNDVSTWSLDAIYLLEVCPELIDK
ncbi:MAG: hypothetical protein J5676_10915 [Bacteroidaceae bacterium]|nr:hypothetical protein [Bacteroidaceae bacterium]